MKKTDEEIDYEAAVAMEYLSHKKEELHLCNCCVNYNDRKEECNLLERTQQGETCCVYWENIPELKSPCLGVPLVCECGGKTFFWATRGAVGYEMGCVECGAIYMISGDSIEIKKYKSTEI